MSVNRYLEHIYIIPEDDANRQIANGFVQHISVKVRTIQVLPFAGGWLKVLEKFKESYSTDLANNSKMHLVLIIDFDDKFDERIQLFKDNCDPVVSERFYVLGTLSEPENLKAQLGLSLENIGRQLVTDCLENKNDTWSHDLLKHNLVEVQRLSENVKPFLFKT